MWPSIEITRPFGLVISIIGTSLALYPRPFALAKVVVGSRSERNEKVFTFFRERMEERAARAIVPPGPP